MKKKKKLTKLSNVKIKESVIEKHLFHFDFVVLYTV